MKRKVSLDLTFFVIILLSSFFFLHIITTNFLSLITMEEIQAIVRKSSVFIVIPALVMPLSFAVSKQFKRAVIVFLANVILVVSELIMANNIFANAFDYAVYSAFSAISCLVFVLEYIIPKMKRLDIPRVCFVTQLIFGVLFMVSNIAFDLISALNPQNYSSARMLSLIPLCAVVFVLPVHFYLKKDFERAIKSLLFPLPAVVVYATLMLLHDNGNLLIWNYRLIYTGGLVCIFTILGYSTCIGRLNKRRAG